MSGNKFIECPGCGALVMRISEPAHRYIGAVAGCWNIYGKVLARESGIYDQPLVHRLIVDTYSAQHPGNESPLTIQSVAVHLMGLYFSLEKNLNTVETNELIKKALLRGNNFVWLNPPRFRGRLNIVDIYKTGSIEELSSSVKVWAEDVWQSWSSHHATIMKWAENIK